MPNKPNAARHHHIPGMKFRVTLPAEWSLLQIIRNYWDQNGMLPNRQIVKGQIPRCRANRDLLQLLKLCVERKGELNDYSFVNLDDELFSRIASYEHYAVIRLLNTASEISISGVLIQDQKSGQIFGLHGPTGAVSYLLKHFENGVLIDNLDERKACLPSRPGVG